MNVFALSLAVGLVAILAELLFLKYARRESIPWKEIVFNLDSGHVVMWAFRGVEIAGFAFLLQHVNLHWVDRWPALAQWTFAFFAWDLCFYCRHRAHHTFGLLWAIHIVHHQGRHYSLSLCNRNSWYAALSDFPFVAILAVLGVPLEIFSAVSSFHYSYQFYNHNGIVNKSGFLEKFLITPSHHRVHHGADPAYFDKNFGGTFLIWDKLFGTFQPERDDIPKRYGLADHTVVESNNPFWASTLPFLAYFKLALPDTRIGIHARLQERFVLFGGVMLFGLLVYYVARESGFSEALHGMLFVGIVLSTIALGAVSDHRPWGLTLWGVVSVAMPLVFVGHFHMHDPAAIILFGMFMLHGLWGIRYRRSHGAPKSGSFSIRDDAYGALSLALQDDAKERIEHRGTHERADY